MNFRHLSRPSAPGMSLCGINIVYYHVRSLPLQDVTCPDCRAIVYAMHYTPPTTGESRYEQART
jgi:hypothetical protein